MKRIFPRDPEVKLYKDGLVGDLYGRVETGKALSDLVERIEDPLVIALDGHWGSGKTYFLKRWVGAHRLENDGKATTVYFDAFANDFLDDPLISLTGVISEQLPQDEGSNAWHKLRNAAAKLAKPIARIGLATATAGATEIVGPILDAAVESASAELNKSAAEFWKKEDGRRAAMKHFRQALELLTADGDGGEAGSRPLVIVVDELDRCRPDYALSLLEVIKHFFAVPNVHFVLGVNLNALEQSVRARYGAAFDAERYLRRFVSLAMPLPEGVPGHDDPALPERYFMDVTNSMEFPPATIRDGAAHIRLAQSANELKFRDINRFVSRLGLVDVALLQKLPFVWKTLVIGMLLFRCFAPELERKARSGQLTLGEIDSFYGISNTVTDRQNYARYDHDAFIIRETWRYLIAEGQGTDFEHDIEVSFDSLRDRRLMRKLGWFANEYLDKVQIWAIVYLTNQALALHDRPA